MIKVKVKGNYRKASRYFERMKEIARRGALDKYGDMGVEALRAATPVGTGLTADSWAYEISHSGGSSQITWYNTNENQGVNIALIIQYGHGTGWGGYVKGIDYINPAMAPVFEQIGDMIWKEVTSA